MHTTTITHGELAGLTVLAGPNGTPCAFRKLKKAKAVMYHLHDEGYIAALTATFPRFIAVKKSWTPLIRLVTT